LGKRGARRAQQSHGVTDNHIRRGCRRARYVGIGFIGPKSPYEYRLQHSQRADYRARAREPLPAKCTRLLRAGDDVPSSRYTLSPKTASFLFDYVGVLDSELLQTGLLLLAPPPSQPLKGESKPVKVTLPPRVPEPAAERGGQHLVAAADGQHRQVAVAMLREKHVIAERYGSVAADPEDHVAKKACATGSSTPIQPHSPAVQGSSKGAQSNAFARGQKFRWHVQFGQPKITKARKKTKLLC